MGANISYYVARGEIYRLITAGYLHSNLMHIASNLFGIYVVVPRL
jgi:rhomboid protease GluP